MTSAIENLEKLLGSPRDGALLRYSLGLEHEKAGDRPRAAARLRESLERDPGFSAAWKALGRVLEGSSPAEALDAYRHGIEAARRKGDRQAEKEMTVFARRLEKRGAQGPA
jgi:tetratricopeptide (TPR) repeat protein